MSHPMEPWLQEQRAKAPAPRESPVWRNRDVGFGAYCIRGTGIRVEFVASRWVAGETIRSLALDYDLSQDRIEDAIRWHMRKHYRRKDR